MRTIFAEYNPRPRKLCGYRGKIKGKRGKESDHPELKDRRKHLLHAGVLRDLLTAHAHVPPCV